MNYDQIHQKIIHIHTDAGDDTVISYGLCAIPYYVFCREHSNPRKPADFIRWPHPFMPTHWHPAPDFNKPITTAETAREVQAQYNDERDQKWLTNILKYIRTEIEIAVKTSTSEYVNIELNGVLHTPKENMIRDNLLSNKFQVYFYYDQLSNCEMLTVSWKDTNQTGTLNPDQPQI